MRNPHHLPTVGIFGRLLAIVALALAVMLAGFAVVGFQAVGQSTERTLQERLTLAQVMAGRVDDRLSESIRMVQLMIESEHLDPKSRDRDAQLRAVQVIREHLGSLAHWVALVNADREMVVAAPDTSDVRSYDFTTAKCPQVVIANQKPVVSCGSALGTTTPAVAMVVPIFDGSDLTGMVFVALNLSSPQFTELIQPVGLGKTSYVELVDGHGMILGSTRPELLWQQDDHRGQIVSLIENKTPVVGTCHACHNDGNTPVNRSEDVMAFAPLSGAKWGVALRQSSAEAFTYNDALERQVILVGGLAFLIAAGLTFIMTRQLVRPLKALTLVCEQIGAGNLEVEIPLSRTGEIGTLAKVLGVMQTRLKESLEKIRGWNAKLETRVKERTRQLEESRAQLLQLNRELSALNCLGDALQQSIDLQTTLDETLAQVVALANAWGASICILDRGAKKFVATERLSIYRDGQYACEWPSVRDVIAKVRRERRAQVVEVPLAVTEQDKIEYREGAELHTVACVPLAGKNRTLGILVLIDPDQHSIASSDLDFLTAVGRQIGIAVENALLFDALKEKEKARSELLAKTIDVQEEERQRIARELHDETSQTLTALNVGLKTALLAPAQTPEDVKRRLAPLKTQAAGMLEEIQRMIHDLRPSLLDDLGLISAIDWYAEARLKSQGIQVEWEVIGTQRRFPRELETALFRVAQEAISNIARHAQAENVSIFLGYEDGIVTLEIEDDGKGIEGTETDPNVRGKHTFGILGMRERVNLFGGDFIIDSKVGQGTRIKARIPVQEAELENSRQPVLAE